MKQTQKILDLEPSRVMFSDHISFKMEISRNTAEGISLGFVVVLFFKKKES